MTSFALGNFASSRLSFRALVPFAVLAVAGVGCNQVSDVDYTELAPSKPEAPTFLTEQDLDTAEKSDSATSSETSAGSTDKPAGPVTDTASSTETTDAKSPPVKPEPTEVPTTDAPAIKVVVTQKEFSVVGPDDALRVTFDDVDLEKVLDVKTVPMEAPRYFPDWLKALDGKRVRMRGYMYPPFQETGLRGFTLTRDTSSCCFGPNPKVCYLIDTFLRKGETTDYIENRPFDVVGVFRIGETVEPGKLYTLDDAIVIPK